MYESWVFWRFGLPSFDERVDQLQHLALLVGVELLDREPAALQLTTVVAGLSGCFEAVT